MSEQKKWVGYADLLEAKRRREQTQERAISANEDLSTEDAESTPSVAQLIEIQQDTRLTPVITPVETPVTTPVATGVSNSTFPQIPASTTPPVSLAAHPPADDIPNQSQYLDATHTASEQRIYSIMYRETISKGVRERHFGPNELCRKTGIRSDRTIRTAIQGLVQKLSIQVVSNNHGNPLGPRYKVFDPKEVVKRRRAAGIEIDPQSKKINDQNLPSPVATPVATPVTTPVATGDKNYRGTPVNSTGVTPVNSTGVFKYINKHYPEGFHRTLSSSNSSAEKADDDENAFMDTLREIYERATGNPWTTNDVVAAQRGRHIAPEVWGIAICYCVDRAPGHRFDRLAYVLEEARRHHEEMSDFAREDLQLIMRHSLRQIERARTSGQWEPAAAREEGGEAGES